MADQKILPAEFRYAMSGLEFPGLHMFVGMTKAGKSNLLKWILYQYSKKQQWNDIFVFCPTGKLTVTKGNYHEFFDADRVFVEIDEYMDEFNKIYEFQKRHPARKILMIFDDCIGSVNFQKDFFTKVAISGRHFNISTIIATQYLRKVQPTIRTNAMTYFIFKTFAENIDCLSDFNTEYKTKKEFKDKLQSWLDIKYNCVRINISSKLDRSIMFFKPLPMDINFKITSPPSDDSKDNKSDSK